MECFGQSDRLGVRSIRGERPRWTGGTDIGQGLLQHQGRTATVVADEHEVEVAVADFARHERVGVDERHQLGPLHDIARYRRLGEDRIVSVAHR